MNSEQLMAGLTVQHLRFTVEALEIIVFQDQPGSALRGALYQALAQHFCSADGLPNHAQHCPVCWLLAAEDEDGSRGENIPRALTVQPPYAKLVYQRGEQLIFGFSLIGQAQNLLPYLLRAVQQMGEIGIGRGRGRFRLLNLSEVNPLLDVERTLMNGHLVKQPTLQVTPNRIFETAATLSNQHLTLEFLTPMRLTAHSKLVKTPEPLPFMQRLLERCQALTRYYGEQAFDEARWQANYLEVSAQASHLQVAYNETRWVEASSGSKRQERYTPISGFTGRVRWEGHLAPLLPWILWGQSLHVGKNAIKGNGWYQIIRKV